MLIHMGWVGEIPAHVPPLVESARRLVGGDRFMFHADERLVPDRWRVAVPPMMRSDILRHAVLREHGGLWLDADVRMLRHPDAWAGAWTTYTAVRLLDRSPLVGTDILFCPKGWPGWDLIDQYITDFAARAPRRIPVLALASNMILACQRQRPEQFSILSPGELFPYDAKQFRAHSAVARGYDPLAEPPTMARKLVNFAKAAVKHVASGMPMASEEEINRRFAICQTCPFLKNGACTKCGCPVNREKRFISKLAWADQKCPVGHW